MKQPCILLLSIITCLLMCSCTDSQSVSNPLNTDFDHYITYLGKPLSAVCDSLRHCGFAVNDTDHVTNERDFGSYSMRVTLCPDTACNVVYCIYLTYYPNDSDSLITNENINNLVSHIGERRSVNGTECSFAMMTKSPDFAEEPVALDIDDAISHRDELDAPASHDYNIVYYWIESSEKVHTVEQLYDLQIIPDTIEPNFAGITLNSTLRNTEYPRKQFCISFSCRH